MHDKIKSHLRMFCRPRWRFAESHEGWEARHHWGKNPRIPSVIWICSSVCICCIAQMWLFPALAWVEFWSFWSLCIYEGHSSYYLLLEPNDFINWFSLGSSRYRMADIFVTEIELTIFLIFRDCTWIHPSISWMKKVVGLAAGQYKWRPCLQHLPL